MEPTDVQKEFPGEPLTSVEMRRDKMMTLLAKNWKLLLKITQDYDLSGTGDSWKLLLEVLLLSEDAEIKDFAKRLMAIISDVRPVPDAEIENRIKQRIHRFKILSLKECRTCRDKMPLGSEFQPRMDDVCNGEDFEISPKTPFSSGPPADLDKNSSIKIPFQNLL